MKFKKSNIFNKEKIFSALGFFWKRIYKILFFVVLIGVIFFGSYTWNKNLYSSTWSSDKKAEFARSQDKGIVFNEREYKKALDIMDQRSNENRNISNVEKDFFASY